jgi:hypothetical protein
VFNKNDFNISAGFNAEYFSTVVGTGEPSLFPVVKFSPNPARDYTLLQFTNPNATKILLTISDMTGKQLYSEMLAKTESHVEKVINLCNYKPGMYILSLKTVNGTKSCKLVVV